MFIIVSNINTGYSQDIEEVLKADSIAVSYWKKLMATDPLVMTGGVSVRLSYKAEKESKQTFNYTLNGNLNTKIFGYATPLAFSFSNRSFNYNISSPIKYNRFRFNPKYKWVKLYLGQSNLSFSPYTLSGVQFSGVGIELTPPGPFKISAMRGRIYDAVAYDTIYPNRLPIYQRDGTAAKVLYNKSSLTIETSFFDGDDKANSLQLPSEIALPVAPLRSVSYSFKSKFSPLKTVNLEIEYASSAVDYNHKINKRPLSEMLWGKFPELHRYVAYKLGIKFNPGKLQTGFSIEHIDPDFKTLGAYYSRSDFQNITLNMAMTLFNGKLSLSGNGGIEVDNLKNQKSEVTSRTVGSLNMMIRPSEKLNMNLTYSNFQSFSNISNQFEIINSDDPYQNSEVLNYLQVSQNASANLNYNLKETKKEMQRLMVMFNMSESNSSMGADIPDQRNVFYNLNALWAYNNKDKNLGLNLSFNSSLNSYKPNSMVMMGPIVSAQKLMLNKMLKINSSIAYNVNLLNQELKAQNFNIKTSCGYVYNEMHTFSFELFFLNSNYTDQASFNSLTTSITYSLKMKEMKLFKPIRPIPVEPIENIKE